MTLDPTREAGRGYYTSASFGVDVTDRAGQWWPIVDGGFTDWTRRLLSDAKERHLVSAIGSDMYVRLLLEEGPPEAPTGAASGHPGRPVLPN